MKTFLSLLKKTLAIIGIGIISIPAAAEWFTSNGTLYDPSQQPFIFRGITVNHSAAPEHTVQAIKDVRAAGANAVQIEFAAGFYGFGADLSGAYLREIIQTCKESKVVCVLEPNDSAGYPSAPGSKSPDSVLEFYTRPEIIGALHGQHDYIMLGLGNQALGIMGIRTEYITRMEYYLMFFHSAFPKFMLMADGSFWGQDADRAMHDLAISMKAFEKQSRKIIYSVEMFDAYTDLEVARDYIASFSEIGAPLVIGGFAPAPYYHPHNHAPLPTVPVELPAAGIMEAAQEYGVGYFAWSWNGNVNTALDMVENLKPQALTPWGDLALNDANGIKETAITASFFGSSSSSSSSSSSIANQHPVAVIDGDVQQQRCGFVNAELSATNSFDPDGDSLTYEWEVYDPYSSRVDHFYGPTLRYSMRPVTLYRFTLTVRDAKGGIGSTTRELWHSYSDNCISSSSNSSSSITSSSSSESSSSSAVSSSSSAAAAANCSYVVQSQWNTGFTAVIRIKNTQAQPINGWTVNWAYADDSRITNLWNASYSGNNPYSANNLNWNSTIQAGQTVEFGFQGSKSNGPATIPLVTGSICQ